MKPFSTIALVLALSAAAQASNNILLIIADDYGTDASSLYNTSPGADLPPTPNIAALATNGVRFSNAYAYPVCSPTRSAMLTGRYGFRTGTGNVISPPSNNLLKASEFTLPDAFAANAVLGYQLKHFGKWHLTGTGGASANLGPCTIGGWPAFAGSLYGEVRLNGVITGATYTNWTKVVSNGITATTSTASTYATTDVVNDAVSWIQTQTTANKPWFAWVAFNAPHTPFHLPSPATLCPHYTSLPGTTAHINANPRSYYNAAVEALDTEIGRLLASVDLAKTTVIFVGDNGTPGQVLQTPFPSGHGKDTLYEGGIRVPLIIRGPNVVSPNRTADGFTHIVDLYATILELAGISAANTVAANIILDSRSLIPVLQNQAAPPTRLYTEEFDTNDPALGGRVLRDDRYKIIRKGTGIDEFYDLQADPYESTNLLAGGVSSMTATRQSYYYRLRFDLGRYTTATTPATSNPTLQSGKFSVTVAQNTGATQTMYRCTDLTNGFWAPTTGATSSLSGSNLTFSDPAPPAGSAFYSILSETP